MTNTRLMNGVAKWCSYYRSNPHRFAHDYLHLNLHLFQKLMIFIMNWCNIVVFIGSRGIGKTFLSAVYCTIRCILWPGTKICIASGVRSQSLNLLEKILMELKPNSPELEAEIDAKETKINGTNAQIVFKNGSYIKVVTASDSSRGNRANLLLIDEFRLVPKDVIDTILRKFLTLRRMPTYSKLSKEQRAAEYQKEKNKTMYLSSAYFSDHWSYTRCVDSFKLMVNDEKHSFVCGLPYELSIKEGLLDRDLIEDEMAESDFSEIKFSMEYECEWFGESEDAFFDYESVAKNRKIKTAYYPEKLAAMLGDKQFKIPPKLPGEKRICSADIALMSSKRNDNDAAALFINFMTPTKAGKYVSNYVYCDSAEGLHTADQALMIRKLIDEYDCDYLVLDTQGIGLGVYDALVRDIPDPETGQIYPAISCCNDDTMADRCTVVGAKKIIWSMKASMAINSDCAALLRDGFRSGKIRLLTTEYDADEALQEHSSYKKLPSIDQVRLQAPHIHTTLLINELVKLDYEEQGGKIKIKERSGMRKDRYSSIGYNYYVACQIEGKLSRARENEISADEPFFIRPPKSFERR